MTPTHCGIVPPYLLEQLRSCDDPALAGRARQTLLRDDELRRERAAAPAAPPVVATAAPRAAGPQRTVHDAEHTETLPGRQVRTETGAAAGDMAVDQAFDGLGDTWQLYEQAYQRDSLDGRGLPLVASVHYGVDYDNAFWNGEQMVFGDGDGTVFGSFTASVDVIGHELTHGVTQYTAALDYQGQPGALNESISDVFGVLVKQRALGQTAEQADWLIGADLLLPGFTGVALRSMAAPGTAYDDPRLGKDPQPATMAGYVETTSDNGGVHLNSGIPNKAFHLVATAIGGHAWEVAGAIWYAVLTGGDIRPDCDFATFAQLTTAAAARLQGEGSAAHAAVVAAWQQVGVTPAATPPAAPSGTGAPTSPQPAPAPTLTVTRTGGFAGTVRTATLDLDQLPDERRRLWSALLADPAALLGPERQAPDTFSYEVRAADGTAAQFHEQQLPGPVRDELRQAFLD